MLKEPANFDSQGTTTSDHVFNIIRRNLVCVRLFIYLFLLVSSSFIIKTFPTLLFMFHVSFVFHGEGTEKCSREIWKSICLSLASLYKHYCKNVTVREELLFSKRKKRRRKRTKTMTHTLGDPVHDSLLLSVVLVTDFCCPVSGGPLRLPGVSAFVARAITRGC